MIGNILDNTTELYMIKYTFGEIFSSGGATLPSVHKLPSFFTRTRTAPALGFLWSTRTTPVPAPALKKIYVKFDNFCFLGGTSIVWKNF